jgi:hypothetical protein
MSSDRLTGCKCKQNQAFASTEVKRCVLDHLSPCDKARQRDDHHEQ